MIENDVKWQWWYWIPDDWWDTKTVRVAAELLSAPKLTAKIRERRRIMAISVVTTILGAWLSLGLSAADSKKEVSSLSGSFYGWLMTDTLKACRPGRSDFSWLCTWGCAGWSTYSSWKYRELIGTSYRYLTDQRGIITEAAKKEREKYSDVVKAALKGVALGAFLLTSFKAYQFMYPSTEEVSSPTVASTTRKDKIKSPSDENPVECQGLLDVSEAEVERRNQVKDAWLTKAVKGMTYKNPNQTHAQLRKIVAGNLSAIFVNDKFLCNGLWLCDGWLCVPQHVTPSEPTSWLMKDNSREKYFSPKTVTPASCVACANADWALVNIPSRSRKNIVPYLNPRPDRYLASMIWRDPTTLDLGMDFSSLTGRISTNVNLREAVNVEWNWPTKTFVGACGAVYLSEGSDPGIVGLHHGSIEGEDNLGLSFIPSPEDVSKAIKEFYNRTSSIPPPFTDFSADRLINNEPVFDPSAPLRQQNIIDATHWMVDQEKPHDSSPVTKQGAMYLGYRSQQAFYKSNALDTIIADEVRNGFDFQKKYGPPKFGRSMWAKSTRWSFNTTPGVPAEDLQWAVDDYMSAFQGELFPNLKEYLRPLSWDEVLNGIDGVRFIDAMNWTSSMGFNYPGKKTKWFEQYTDCDGNIKRKFNEGVFAETLRILADMLEGTPPGFRFNATPKDEPTPAEKEKVRLFMVAEICCTLIVRKYYTPVCRVLQMLTGISECAVGMNCVSKDWDDMILNLRRFANFFDGDYSKYDLRMSQDVSLAAYNIMINIAAMGDYTSDDLYVMGILAHELSAPIVNFNGDVCLLEGSTPSGIPVTVIINSLCNSLLNRCAFHSIYPHLKPGCFRRYVAHINYGDDFVNSVSWFTNRFNFITMQFYLAKYDIVLTPGVKDAKPTRFMKSFSDIIFLQRRSVLLPELTIPLGRLERKSILKSLTCVLRSTAISPALAAATNVDGALREFVLYGEEEYEISRKKLRDICVSKGIAHLCNNLDVPYIDMLKFVAGDYFK
eukprot:NODE_3_length_6477_cov_14.703780_g2_i0.p1 GENE.NODE_3_length_6477_cov_14.703780_g2_i0~~NODE_3_length_6477_cov_14.703780_g2_i0.p1  ORF type:complete len:1002 (+),score=32.05 NODE_3_length_6477_cov_14.703780_g2_i0:819-3824(+)